VILLKIVGETISQVSLTAAGLLATFGIPGLEDRSTLSLVFTVSCGPNAAGDMDLTKSDEVLASK
jgi:hypothetical protein